MRMHKNIISLAILAAFGSVAKSDDGSDESLANLVKMCLFYGGPSGHARSDPILSQTCASDHVHTFYGPQNFHPDTTYEDIRDTSPQYSSTPTVENQSLYWHPSIYQVSTDASGAKTYNRVNNLETSPYYRWDTTLLPAVEAFPPGFRMIAYSNENLLVECCNMIGEEESCTEQDGNLNFPSQNCDFVGIAFAMPTCWNGNLGIDNDHINHMAYTMNGGGVAGECPDGYDRRLPEIQLFVRIPNYQGATFEYTLSDESNVFHVDFMNGWEEGKLQEIINNCPVTGNGNDGYNPPCGCDEFLTPNNNVAGPVCDSDTKNLIVNEDTDVVNVLPRGTCQGASLIPKSWDLDPPLECTNPSPAPPSEDEDEEPEGPDEDEEDPGPECVDSPLLMFVNGKTKDCDWVARRKERRCNKPGVAAHCPASCEECESLGCSDTGRRFRMEGISWKVRCNFFVWNPDRCEDEGAAETCRDTCGYCDGR